MGLTFGQLLADDFEDMDEEVAFDALYDTVEGTARWMSKDNRHSSEVRVERGSVIIVDALFRSPRYGDPGDMGEARTVEITPQRRWLESFKRRGTAEFKYYWEDEEGLLTERGREVAKLTEDAEDFFAGILHKAGL